MSLSGRKPIRPEVFEKVKSAIQDKKGIKEIKLNEDGTEIEVWFVDDYPNGSYGGELGRELRKEIEPILNEFNLEMGGMDNLSNWEEFLKADKEYDEAHPKPVDPRYTREWKKRSYYDRTKGKGSKEVEAYKNEMIAWRAAKEKANLPKRSFPGFSFGVDPLGTYDAVRAFYAGSNWTGD